MTTLSPELHGRETTPVLDMGEVQLLESAHRVSSDAVNSDGTEYVAGHEQAFA